MLNQINSQIQLHLADYMSHVLRFLASPFTVNAIKNIETIAKADGVDVETFKAQTGRRYTGKMNSTGRPSMLHLVDQLYLEEWSNEWMKLKIDFNHFGIDPDNEADSSDRKKWTDSMDTYWTNIIKHAKSIADGVPDNARDDISLIKLYMPRKLSWLQKGYILTTYDRAVRELPVANKFIFAQIQQLFAGGNTLKDAIIEVSK